VNKLSRREYRKLVNILKEYKQYFSSSFEEDIANIVESISIDAKKCKSDISKAKIKLISTPKGPEIGVVFEE
jgi:ribosomal protein S17E